MTIGIIIGGILLGIITGGWCGILLVNLYEDTPPTKSKKRKIIIVSIIIFSCLWIAGIHEDIQKQAQPQTHCHCECCTGMRD